MAVPVLLRLIGNLICDLAPGLTKYGEQEFCDHIHLAAVEGPLPATLAVSNSGQK